MHLISNERAMAHWRTLCLLPQDQLNFLEERFTQEQPLLARALGELTDAVDCPAEAWQRPEADARLAQFGQMLVRGSCLAELFRREAGHALRRLDETEINSILESNVRLADALEKALGPGILETGTPAGLVWRSPCQAIRCGATRSRPAIPFARN